MTARHRKEAMAHVEEWRAANLDLLLGTQGNELETASRFSR